MQNQCTAAFRKVPEGYIGVVEALPGANTQGDTPEEATKRFSSKDGMSTSEPRPGERILDVRCDEDSLSVDLADGRSITVPLAWFPCLLRATPAQRANWRIGGGGFGIHWPDVDEDLSSQGLLRGAPAPRHGHRAEAGGR